MLEFGVYVSIPDMSRLDINALIGALHEHADELAPVILRNIEDRTPELTGALKEDETYELGREPGELVTWFVGQDYQIGEWGHIYAQYQEGPPLGQTTYTAGEHQMFARVATDDIDTIRAWAEEVVQGGLDDMVDEANAGTETFS